MEGRTLMLVTNKWKDYELIDAGDGERLERWGQVLLRRPDPHVIWPASQNKAAWEKVHACYLRSDKGGGNWEFYQQLPERWTISYGKFNFYVRAMGFKHTGIFPEQAVNWDWITEQISGRSKPVRVLNLFAYTGGATVAAAAAGAEVCHVDAAKGMVTLAKENLALSGLREQPVRFIVDDVLKFVRREQRRGRQYEGIIMDPPSFGRGPGGEVWKIENSLYELVEECAKILSDQPIFMLINSYTDGLAPSVMGNMLNLCVKSKYGGNVTAAEVGLPVTASGLVVPCGACARWEA